MICEHCGEIIGMIKENHRFYCLKCSMENNLTTDERKCFKLMTSDNDVFMIKRGLELGVIEHIEAINSNGEVISGYEEITEDEFLDLAEKIYKNNRAFVGCGGD